MTNAETKQLHQDIYQGRSPGLMSSTDVLFSSLEFLIIFLIVHLILLLKSQKCLIHNILCRYSYVLIYMC